MHWSHILTSRLTSEVKLVGATISCEPCWQGGDVANAKRHNAHVQSYFMATDQARTALSWSLWPSRQKFLQRPGYWSPRTELRAKRRSGHMHGIILLGHSCAGAAQAHSTLQASSAPV